MIGTVEEAMDWWCPLYRAPANDPAGNSGVTCIADGCAAWRWRYNVELPDHRFNMMATSPPQKPVYTKTDRGYCGAFGKPEAE